MVVNVAKPRNVDSKKSLDISKTRLDSILERYEKIFGKQEEKYLEPEEQEFINNLKPRIPPCLQEKDQVCRQSTPTHITKQQIPEIMRTAETFEVEEITSDVLDELLSELTEHGFNEGVNALDNKVSPRDHVNEQPSQNKIIAEKCGNELTTTAKNSQADLPIKDLPKSFNYQEIKESLVKMNQPSSTSASETEDARSQKTESIKRMGHAATTSVNNNVLRKQSLIQRSNLEDAMELHRTKSYVVNLIDTALSNHFGTNLCEKSLNKECTKARSAVQMLKNQSTGKIDKDLCLEIAQVLTDSFVSSSTAPSNCEQKTADSECTCKSQIDEPSFVKQLKQMRWGHLKHIQREVRRLEDLERFLDSCSSSAFEKYSTH